MATINGANLIVISGKHQSSTKVLSGLGGQEVRYSKLNVSHTSILHPCMDSILDDFRKIASSITFSKPRFTFISNVDGKVEDEIRVTTQQNRAGKSETRRVV